MGRTLTPIAEEIERQGSNGEVVTIVKATVLGAAVDREGGLWAPKSNATDPEDRRAAFIAGGLIEPPYDPRLLVNLYEMSSALRPNVDAYVNNIDAFGHAFHPVFDWESVDVRDRISDALLIDNINNANTDPGAPDAKPPTDAEVDAEIEKIKSSMRIELARTRAFFDSCVINGDFVSLRRVTRQDLESLGNAYWEVIRDNLGDIRFFKHVPAFTMLLSRLGEPIPVAIEVKLSDLTFDTINTPQRFRKFAQVVTETHARVWFKEFGDPRVMSSRTGLYYESIDDLKTKEGDAPPATEVLHFRIYSARTPYGVPRWIGALLSVLGTRQAEEVNFLFFENKSIPPMAILVSGGRLAPGAADQISNTIREEIRGKKNFHKILVIEAEPAGKHTEYTGRFKIQLQPLTQAVQSDALFQNYDERNADKVGQQFRLPRIIRGDIRDFNKSTAESSLMFAEMQVFQPEREEFDTTINKTVMRTRGVRYWRFGSKSPVTRDPKTMSDMIVNLVRGAVLTPAEGRVLAADVFNHEFKRLDAPWTSQPMQLTIAELQVKAKELAAGLSNDQPDQVDAGQPDAGDSGDAGDGRATNNQTPKPAPAKSGGKLKPFPTAQKRADERVEALKETAKAVIDLNKFLDGYAAETTFDDARKRVAKSLDDGETLTIRVPSEVIRSWFEEPPPTS